MPQVVIGLTSAEKMALLKLAKQELRDPRSQAYLIIRRELERNGLIEPKEGNQQIPAKSEQGEKRNVQ